MVIGATTAQDDLSWLLDLLPSAADDVALDKLLHASSAGITDDTLLLAEAFDTADAWEDFSSSTGTMQVADGAYEIFNSRQNTILWGQNASNYRNVAIQVDTRQLSTAADNGYGVLCRASTSPNDLDAYYFLISGQGYYTIFAIHNRAFVSLHEWTFADVINIGKDVENHIVAVCHDDYLSLYVNNTLLAEVNDDRMTGGAVGMGAIIYQADSDVRVAFDNLEIWSLHRRDDN